MDIGSVIVKERYPGSYVTTHTMEVIDVNIKPIYTQVTGIIV